MAEEDAKIVAIAETALNKGKNLININLYEGIETFTINAAI
jgi:hypothetical protein